MTLWLYSIPDGVGVLALIRYIDSWGFSWTS
jgi:hypothetical protein